MSISPQIPGPPQVLVLEASGTSSGGWTGLAQLSCNVMRRQGVQVWGPVEIATQHDLAELIGTYPNANCLFMIASGQVQEPEAGVPLATLWQWLTHESTPSSKLVAVYTCQKADPQVEGEILAPGNLAAIAVVSNSELTAREATLFFPEFFSELNSHCHQGINAAMARFCFGKASRFAPGKTRIRT